MMQRLQFAVALAVSAAPVLAQLPAPTVKERVAPRAAWSAVTSAGTSSTTLHQRADNTGAASADKLYVFGGCKGNNTTTTLNDLWEFDALAGTFTQLLPNTATPAPAGTPTHRGRACVAWNFSNSRLVLFGGNTRKGGNGLQTDTLLNDTWEWDPNTNTWTDVTPVSGNPSPREHAAMSWDPLTGGMLMFGGDADGSDATPKSPNAETWLFLGGVWTPILTATTPPARANHYIMARPDFGDVVMCGGGDYSGSDRINHLDVWQWTGGNWTALCNYDVPSSTQTAGTGWQATSIGTQAAYDPLRRRIVQQGGQGLNQGAAGNVTYVYGADYGGSPSNYTSEFDCVTNTWSIYGTPTAGATPYNNNDPVIGRVSRAFFGFVPATGKLYKVCGQNAVAGGGNPLYNVYEYQATPPASTESYGAGCHGMSLSADNGPWTERTFTVTGTGFGPFSIGLLVLGIGPAGQFDPGVPFGALGLPGPGVGCELLAAPNIAEVMLPPLAAVQTWSLVLPELSVDPTLAGLEFSVQAVDLDHTGGTWSSTYSSNGLKVVIGAL
jgi:hypothetical protein